MKLTAISSISAGREDVSHHGWQQLRRRRRQRQRRRPLRRLQCPLQPHYHVDALSPASAAIRVISRFIIEHSDTIITALPRRVPPRARDVAADETLSTFETSFCNELSSIQSLPHKSHLSFETIQFLRTTDVNPCISLFCSSLFYLS
jgi:hypothetical protein